MKLKEIILVLLLFLLSKIFFNKYNIYSFYPGINGGFFMFFWNKKITTVDIGSFAVKVIQFIKKNGEVQIVDTGREQLQPDIIENSEIKDVSFLASKLNKIFENLEHNPSHLITTVPSSNLVIRVIEMPIMDEGELADAIKWEADDFLPFPGEDARLDYLIVNRNETNFEIMVTATRTRIVENYLEPFQRLNLKPEVMNVQPLALFSLLLYSREEVKSTAVLDIGASASRIIMGNQEFINLSRSLDIGSNNITEALMEDGGMEYEEAEEYKIENGIEKMNLEAEDEQSELDMLQLENTGIDNGQIIYSVVTELADEVSRTIDFYQRNNNANIDVLHLTGGGSQLEGLPEVLEEEINLEIEFIKPFDILPRQKPVLEEGDMEFSVAAGLGVSEVLADES